MRPAETTPAVHFVKFLPHSFQDVSFTVLGTMAKVLLCSLNVLLLYKARKNRIKSSHVQFLQCKPTKRTHVVIIAIIL